MPTTWDEMLSEIRVDINDTDPVKPRWSDLVLYVYAKDAIRDYSTWFPRRVDQAHLTYDATNQCWPLPSDFIADIYVESPQNTFYERRQSRPGQKYPHYPTKRKLYYIEGGNLYVAPSISLVVGDVFLTYFATHLIPTSETDCNFVLSIPDADIELIRLFVKAKAFEQIRGRQAILDRFKAVGDRADNPLIPETGGLMDEYYAKIARRLPGGVITLYRAGKIWT